MDKVSRIAPMVLFCLFAIKSIVVAPGLSDGLVLAILAVLVGFIEYKISESRLNEIKVKNLELEHKLNDLVKSQSELKSFVQALNMQANFNKIQPRSKGL